MKHIIISALIALFAVTTAVAQDDIEIDRSNVKTPFFRDVESYGRLGYNIGGNAPLPMPATIRSLNKFSLQPNLSVGVDVIKPVAKRWGVLVGLHFENKGMHIDADVKNYHMEIVKDGERLEGVFTGKNNTKATEWMFTLPVQGVFNIKPNVRLKFGPYFSYLTQRKFEGYAYNGYLRVDDPTGAKIELGDTEDTRGDYDFNGDMRRFQMGLDLGVDWYFARRLGVYADLAWGLSGTFPGSFKTLEQTLYPIYGTIGLTYKIR